MEQHNVYADSSTATTLTTTTETVLVALPAAVNAPAGTQVILEGDAAITTGTGVTAIVCRLRKGNAITGAVVGQPFTLQTGASLGASIAAQAADVPAVDIAQQQYCLTVQQTAATGNGAAVFASLQATWFSQ